MSDPSTPSGSSNAPRRVRHQRPERRQMTIQTQSLDQTLPPEHPVRLVWEFVQKLDLSSFYADIRTFEGEAGRPPIDPQVLTALWLQATIDGVSSAREIERLTRDHLVYRWLCGGISVNHHRLSDFRSQDPQRLEALLVRVVGSLMAQGLVTLQRVAQDGMRVRASAGASSFRRRPRLEECLKEARAQVEALKQRDDEDDPPGEADRRSRSARERAASERAARIEEALRQLEELEQKRESRQKGDGATSRCSTTDPDARRMKMADGGTRPAYNVELATTDGTRLIVGVEVTSVGSDRGRLGPMAKQLCRHYGRRPVEHLADGGFTALEDIEKQEAAGTRVYVPVKLEAARRAKGEDPFAPQPGDSPEVIGWRSRMGTQAAQAIYRLRSSIAEFPNAVLRNRGLRQFVVRGREKAKSSVLWQALAYNLTRIVHLGWLPALG